MSSRNLLRVVAWATLGLIILWTLAPIGLRPHSGLPVQTERLLAFAVAGFLMGLAYPRHIIVCAALVLGAAVMLEVLQLVTPSRHGRGIDLVAKLIGGSVGISAAWAVHSLIGKRLWMPAGRRGR